MKPKQWIKSPKGTVLLITVVFLALASYSSHSTKGLYVAAIAVASALAVDVVCCLIEKRKRIFPDGAFITGIIVSLILSVTSSWYIVAATSVLAILSKHLLKSRKRPIFNPAAFGLLLSVPLFHSQQSWWGAFGDFAGWYAALILIAGYWVVNRIQKFPLVFAFLGVYFAAMFVLHAGVLPIDSSSLASGGLYDALRPPFINATLFFAFFMLTDLPTSPAKTGDQIVSGILAGLAGAVIYMLFGGLIYLFIGLMAANFYQFLRSRFGSRAATPVNPKLKKAGF